MGQDEIAAIVAGNRRRLAMLADNYNPLTGEGCHGDRIEVTTPVEGLPVAKVPRTMVDDPQYSVATSGTQWRILRCRHDFEYWCASCATVKHKTEGSYGRLWLNRAQRKVLAVLEGDRLAGRPIRMILLKARQWGGSTLVQMYMAWIQSCHRRNWHSLICSHVKDSAATIRGMYTRLLEHYPEELWEGDEDSGRPQFKPFERSVNVREITGRGCRVALASSENQEAVRGSDIAMAHLSETAFWRSSKQHSPADFIRSVCGSVALMPYSLVVMESTANGVGNYFHNEWLRCKAGHGDKHAVFVAWYEIEIYTLALDRSPEEFASSLTDYELALWHRGCTLEQINWYRRKSAEYPSREKMQAEFPSDDIEAFANTGAGVFALTDIERLRAACGQPLLIGSMLAGHFVEQAGGEMKIWQEPQESGEYIVAVDVGGRSASADWSVIAVMRRGSPDGSRSNEIAAQWRGHVDHDRLAEIARLIAESYNEALLIIESNTLECETDGGCTSNLFVLSRLAERYGNLYRRRSFDSISGSESLRIGFHTNRATKAAIVAGLIEAVREGGYVERDHEACNELAVYEQRQNGSYGAKEGYHDDIVMTRALALHALRHSQPCAAVPPPGSINRPIW